jgi:hypothetical protein
MGFSHEDLERLRSTLKEAPKVTTKSGDITKQEAVASLVREIQTLQKRGYSLEEIAEMLQGGGLLVTTPTLKSYLSRAKAARERSKEARPRRKATAGANAPAVGGGEPEVTPDPPGGATSTGAGRGTSPEVPATGQAGAGAPLTRIAPVKSGVGSATAGAAAGDSTEPPKLRSRKEAFLIKDKDSY